MKLDVVEVQVKDWKTSIAWWKKFGLKLVVRENDDQLALLRSGGGSMIGLFGKGKPTKHGFTPYFRVHSINSTVVSLKKKGIIVGRIEKRHWGRQAKVTDPECRIMYVFEET